MTFTRSDGFCGFAYHSVTMTPLYRATYADGSLRAARFVVQKTRGLFGMDGNGIGGPIVQNQTFYFANVERRLLAAEAVERAVPLHDLTMLADRLHAASNFHVQLPT